MKEISESVNIYNLHSLPTTNTHYLKYYTQGIDPYLNSITAEQNAEECAGGHGAFVCRAKRECPALRSYGDSFILYTGSISVY